MSAMKDHAIDVMNAEADQLMVAHHALRACRALFARMAAGAEVRVHEVLAAEELVCAALSTKNALTEYPALRVPAAIRVSPIQA